jgi:hypothetical protein
MGGVGRCVVENVGLGDDELDVEGGTGPMTMGIQTEGGSEDINDVD